MNSLHEFQREVGGWADQTFPDSTPYSIICHLQEEAHELRFVIDTALRNYDTVDESGLQGEAADCLLLLLHLAHKRGFDLLRVARQKHDLNSGRTWETDAGEKGYWKHVEPSCG